MRPSHTVMSCAKGTKPSIRDTPICKKVFFQQSYTALLRGLDFPLSLTVNYPRYLVISPHTKYTFELKKKNNN